MTGVQTCALPIFVPDDVAFLEKTNGDNEVVIDLESLSEVERKIYELVKREGEMSFEKIARLTKTGVSKVMSVITEMEIKGLIDAVQARTPNGQTYILAKKNGGGADIKRLFL